MPASTAKPPSASGCRIISLGRVDEPRGSLCVAEVGQHIPFEIRRVYWVFDVPGEGERAHHTHREQHEVLIAAQGAFTVHCEETGDLRSVYVLDSPDVGLLLPPMAFHHLDGFAPGAVCLVLASGPYDSDEYIYDYDEFRELVRRR